MLQFIGKIVGQHKTVSILEKFIENSNFPHAFMFVGRRGVGKYYSALQFAKEANSSILNNQTIKQKFNQLEEPFIKYIIPINDTKTERVLFENGQKLTKDENAIFKKYNHVIKSKIENPYSNLELIPSSAIRINQIRDIKKFLSFSFPEIPFRIVIIEHADLMTEEAQNSLLKNLEEPPQGIVFILLVSNTEKIFSTIKSRCQIINFDPLKADSLIKILIDYFSIAEEKINPVLDFAEGSVFNAIKFIDYDIKEKHLEILNLMRSILTNRFREAIAYWEKDEKDVESISLTLSLIKIWFNDCLKIANGNKNIYFVEFESNIENFIKKYSGIRYYEIDQILSEVLNSLSKNINLTLLYLHAIFEIKQLSK